MAELCEGVWAAGEGEGETMLSSLSCIFAYQGGNEVCERWVGSRVGHFRLPIVVKCRKDVGLWIRICDGEGCPVAKGG